MRFGSNKPVVRVSGDLLIGEFQSALANLVTMDAAEAEAHYSEASIENALKYQAPKNGVYLTPQDITPEAADALMRNSVDAHLKKVQAEQIKAYASSQVSQQQRDVEQNYKGRKVKITAFGNSKDIFIAIWTDKRTGQAREGTYKGKSVTGTIDDIALEKNLLVIKPTWAWRTIQPDRRYFLVVVLNMRDLSPNVEIKLV